MPRLPGPAEQPASLWVDRSARRCSRPLGVCSARPSTKDAMDEGSRRGGRARGGHGGSCMHAVDAAHASHGSWAATPEGGEIQGSSADRGTQRARAQVTAERAPAMPRERGSSADVRRGDHRQGVHAGMLHGYDAADQTGRPCSADAVDALHPSHAAGGMAVRDHAGHDKHEGHSVGMFRDSLWISLALIMPTLIWCHMLQSAFGNTAPMFPARTRSRRRWARRRCRTAACRSCKVPCARSETGCLA